VSVMAAITAMPRRNRIIAITASYGVANGGRPRLRRALRHCVGTSRRRLTACVAGCSA
jgi:hypothetical protein